MGDTHQEYVNYIIVTRYEVETSEYFASYITLGTLIGFASIKEKGGGKRAKGNLHFFPLLNHIIHTAIGKEFDPLEDLAREALREWGISRTIRYTLDDDLTRMGGE